MPTSLKEKAFEASVWRLIASFGIQGTNFIVQIVLARILLPEDFGLIGMIYIFIAITEVLVISGFASALIQRQSASYLDECSVFHFNIAISILGCLVLVVLAPWVAAFYGYPILTPLVRVLSLKLIIGAFGHVQLSLLMKQIDFKSRCILDTLAVFLSGIVGIALAIYGFGVWSLVAQQMMKEAIRVVLAWRYNPWRPSMRFSVSSLQRLFGFGSNVLLSSLINTIYRNIYFVVIGKLFSARNLGFYSRAFRLQEIPSQHITSVVAGVAFPVFSRIQDDNESLVKGLKTSLGILALGVFPTMCILALVARPLVTVLLTDKWLACVPYLQMLCIVGALEPFFMLSAKITLATGRSGLLLKLNLFQKTIAIVAILFTFRFGITGIITGQIAASLISTLLISTVVGKLVGYPLVQQIRDVLPYLGLTVLSGAVVVSFEFLPIYHDGALLLLQTAAGISMYLSCCYLLKPNAFVVFMDLVRRSLEKRSNSIPVST